MVNVDDTPHGTLLGFIDYTFDRVPLMVIIVKTCTLNGFGDIRVMLKVVKFNSVFNNYIVIFRIFIHESFNFKILQGLLMALCDRQS